MLLRLAAVVWLLGLAPALAAPQAPRPFKKMTVQSILKRWKRADGARVELHGWLFFGFETSAFRDDSLCGHRCGMWVTYDERCAVVGGGQKGIDCSQAVERSAQALPNPSGSPLSAYFQLNKVVLRGVVFTVRRDIGYAKGTPKSVRVGFGHLSGYPAEITVEELEIEPSLPLQPRSASVSVHVVGDVQASKLLSRLEPECPTGERCREPVRYRIIVGTDGRIQNFQLISGRPKQVAVANAALETWVYQPTVWNGVPIEVETEIDVTFRRTRQ